MPKIRSHRLKPCGPKSSQIMSAHLTAQHDSGHIGSYVEAFKSKFPTRDDAIQGFTSEMLATASDLSGPFSQTQSISDKFVEEFSKLSDVQKEFMKNIHIDNYYSALPKPMIFESGVTSIPGGEVLLGTVVRGGVEYLMVKVMCKHP